jgi:hypothetical protein
MIPKFGAAAVLGLAFAGSVVMAQDPAKESDGAKQEYEVHDMRRPEPPAVTPATPSTQEQAGKAPSDAKVLFDGTDLSHWKAEKGQWNLKDGVIECKPGTGSLVSNDEFGSMQLHIEWNEPEGIKGESQGRGNSGVFLMGLYELQVLDVHGNKTYPDGMAGGLYGQYPPLANASLAQGQWQTYDVVFHRAIVQDGKVTKPATVTVFWNGVLVQDHSELIGPTLHRQLAKYSGKEPEKGPIKLQDHGNPVRFRNIWVREIPDAHPVAPVKPAGAGH